MPGFTHLQVAQPVTFGHHLLAYVEMFERDRERMLDARRRVNRLPLGAAALAGTTFPIDRECVAQRLGFEAVAQNSLDAVCDRDFAIEFCAAAALAMMHVSRLAEELVIWMNPRFGFVGCPTASAPARRSCRRRRTRTSPELARGKTGRVFGNLTALLTLMKGQPLAVQQGQPGRQGAAVRHRRHAARHACAPSPRCSPGSRSNAAAMRRAAEEGYSTATDLADYLVRRGMPFRDAHEAVARAVRLAGDRGCDLAALPLADLQAIARRDQRRRL